jgi:hypothetical protein
MLSSLPDLQKERGFPHPSRKKKHLKSKRESTRSLMYAPREHGQHLCHRVLSVACSGFLTVADMKGNVGATRGSKEGQLPSLGVSREEPMAPPFARGSTLHC